MCPSLVSCLDLHAFVLGARDPGFGDRLDWEEVWSLAPGLCDVLRPSTLPLGGWMQTEICAVGHVVAGMSAGPGSASAGILDLMSFLGHRSSARISLKWTRRDTLISSSFSRLTLAFPAHALSVA